jgi:hypothetical protein
MFVSHRGSWRRSELVEKGAKDEVVRELLGHIAPALSARVASAIAAAFSAANAKSFRHGRRTLLSQDARQAMIENDAGSYIGHRVPHVSL